MLLTLTSKVIGFFRDIFLAYYYGATRISDVYIISLTIPGVVFAFIGTAISTSFIPIYTAISKNSGDRTADKFLNNLISTFFIVCTVIVLLIYISTAKIVQIFALGFDVESLEMAVLFTRITVFGIYFSMLTHIYSAYLNIKGKYNGPAFMGVPFNVILIVSIIISAHTSIIILPLGILMALIGQLLFLVTYITKQNYKYNFFLNLKDPNLKEILILALPVIMGVSINQLNILVDRTMASTLLIGGISIINYSSRLNDFAIGIFVISLLNITYPKMSILVIENKLNKLKEELVALFRFSNIIIIPVSVFVMMFSKEIIQILYGRGAFNQAAIEITSKTLVFYTIGLIAISYREIISKVFYSLKDTKTPTVNAVIGLIINIVLNIILSRLMGLSGLALATTISAFITVILLSGSLIRKVGKLRFNLIFTSLMTILPLTIVSALLNYYVYQLLLRLELNDNILFLFIGVSYVIITATLFGLFKIDEVTVFLKLLKMKIKPKNTEI